MEVDMSVASVYQDQIALLVYVTEREGSLT